MVSEVTVGRGCGWIRVAQEPSTQGTLVYLNSSTAVADVTRELLLSPGLTIWVQYGGGEPRPLSWRERPLAIQNQFLLRLGFTDASRRARLGIDPDLRYLIAFHTGPKWFCRSGEVWLLKGLVLPQWKKKNIVLKNGLMIIQSVEGGDWGREAVRVDGVESGEGPRGGRSVVRVTSGCSGNKSLYLGFDRPWQQNLWLSWLKQERDGKEGQFASRGLDRVPRGIGRSPTLDLSDNRLGSCGLSARDEVEDDTDTWTGLAEVSGLARLNLSSNNLDEAPREIWTHLGLVSLNLSHNRLTSLPDHIRLNNLEELRLDGNLLERLPAGEFPKLLHLSAANNRLTFLPLYLLREDMRALTLLDANEGEPAVKPEDLKSINLRANLLKGNIILGNYGNLTQLDVSENSIECLDLRALDKLQSVQCSRNRLQELFLNGTSLSSVIAGNNCLNKLVVHPKPTKLKHLDISYNQLETLPDWLGSCQQLRTLFASHNLLTSLPDHLFCSELSSLQTLQLSFNNITALPQIIRHIPLQQLFLQSNQITHLPQHFFLATSRLRVLNLSKNELTALPENVGDGHQLERLYLTCNQLSDIHILTMFTNLRILHVAYNLIIHLPELCVGSWPDMEELILSGNRIDRLPGNIAQWQHLRVLRLHGNLLTSCPILAMSTSLKVVDLSHNNLVKIDLLSLVPKQLQFLDISGNDKLTVDARQFQNYKSQRQISLVDVSGQNRESLPTGHDPSGKADRHHHDGSLTSYWPLGFSETPGNREKLCISQLRMTNFCNNEALLGLFDSGNNTELPHLLAQSIPRILLEERTVKETANEYMKYTLLAAHRELKEKGQKVGVCAMVCHICSERGTGMKKRTLRLATVGEAKAVLCRGDSSLTLAHVPTQMTRSQIGNSAMFPLVVPDPHVTEITLRESDEFLIMANKRLWEVVSPENAISEIRDMEDPVLGAKRLQDLAQSFGCEDNLSILVVKLNNRQDFSSREVNYTFQLCDQKSMDVFDQQHLGYECHQRDPLEGNESMCWCHGDRSSPSGQSDQASYGRGSRENYTHYLADKNELIERQTFPSVLMREKGTRKMSSSLVPLEVDFDDIAASERTFGSARSFQSGFSRFGNSSQRSLNAGPNAAYFGSLQRLMPYHLDYDFSIIKERSEADSLETEDRMSKYWDVATTEL